MRESLCDHRNEVLGGAYGIAGIRWHNSAGGTSFVIGRLLEVIGGGEVASEPGVDCGIGFGEHVELALNASMRFGDSIGVLEDQCLRSMKLSIAGKTRRLPRDAYRQDALGIGKRFSSAGEVGGGLRFHRSRPSLRISCISGEELSRQLPSG